MASSAGQLLEAGRIPGELIGETVETSDSATFTTTETTVVSLTVPLVSGRTYRIAVSSTSWNATVSTDNLDVKLREDNTTGTTLNGAQLLDVSTATQGTKLPQLEARYTATATANKTFVVTGQRTAGTGNLKLEADPTRPAILSCYYHSG